MKTVIPSKALILAFSSGIGKKRKDTDAPAGAPDDAPAGTKKRERLNVTVSAVIAPMALPVGMVPNKRGSKSKYKFDELAAPVPNPNGQGMLYASFGLKGMNKKGFSSTLFTQNAKHKRKEIKKDDNGNTIMKPGPELKDANGIVVGHSPGTEPETYEVSVKEFMAIEVDPSNDPDGASLRVFRIK